MRATSRVSSRCTSTLAAQARRAPESRVRATIRDAARLLLWLLLLLVSPACLALAAAAGGARTAARTLALVCTDPNYDAWAAALASDATPAAGECATRETLAEEAWRRHELRLALLESLARRGIAPTAPPAGAGPWPWGSAPGPHPALVDSGDTAILVDDGTITYTNRYREPEVDPFLAARAFYAAHDDEYDFLILFTNFPTQLVGGAFLAYHQAVANDVTGLGYSHVRSDELFDDATLYTGKPGPGRLQSFVHMNAVDAYPLDPHATYSRQYSSVTLLAHEVGHRWLARVRLEAPGYGPAPLILGRQRSHWSFFFDSGGSPVEGNDWTFDGARHRTLEAPLAYGPLDLYLMGMLAPAEVGPELLWYVDQPQDLAPPYDEFGGTWGQLSPPTPGVGCTGRHVPFTIDDVALANGYRLPAYPQARRDFHAAFALVVRDLAEVTPEQLAKLAALRDAFHVWFGDHTQGRGSFDASLHRVPARIVFLHRPHGDFEDETRPIPIETRVSLEQWSQPTRLEDVRLALEWSVDGGPSSAAAMTSSAPGEFVAEIPPQPLGGTVRYWLRGTSNFPGHEHRWPADAPDSTFRFRIAPDTRAPSVQHLSRTRWSRLAEPPLLRALVRDAHGVDAVWIESRVAGRTAVASQPLQPVGTSDLYETRLALPGRIGDTIEYRIVARDVAASPHLATLPASGWFAIALERGAVEDAEAEDPMWTHRSLAFARPDEWHREIVSPIGGHYSWKVGPEHNTAPGSIAPRQNSVLESPAIQVFPGAKLTFRHRYAFLLDEFVPRRDAADGGLVEWQDVERDGPLDRWYILEPDSGYTHTVSHEGESPLRGYPVFSGSEPFARTEVCTFPEWAVNRTVRLRFHVATAPPDPWRPAQDGWVLDDIQIDPGPPPTGVTLAALTAERTARGVRLAWSAPDAEAGDSFGVERALPPALGMPPAFETIARLSAVAGRRDYEFEDVRAPAGAPLLYRVGLWSDGVEVASRVLRVEAAPRFVLHPNAPNPFNPSTRLRFELPLRARARLAVYDVRGRLVRTLVDATLDAGAHSLLWDGTDAAGQGAASGLYLCRLRSDGREAVVRMLLVR